MEKRREDLEQVKAVLQSAPRGMTITGVADRLQVNRNSVAKYLDMLLMSGEVSVKTFGRSKIYSISTRMPLATALSLSSEMIVLIDADLRVLDVNDQFLRFAKLRRDEITGQALEHVKTELLTHRNILLYVKDALNGKEYTREICVGREQQEACFKVRLIPLASGDAQRKIAIIYEDITARKKAEVALKESEARYRAVVEDQTDLIIRMLPDTTITFVNDAWCRNFDFSREKAIGNRHIDLIPPQFRADFRRDLDSITPAMPTLAVETPLVLPDGRMQWMTYMYRGIFGEKGLTEIQVVAHDITARKNAELALKESEARYRAVVEDQSDHIVRIRPDSTITFFNEAYARYWGMDGKTSIGRRLFDFMRPEGCAIMRQRLSEISADRATDTYEGETMTPRGVRWLSWTYRGIFDVAGQLVEYQIVSHDITDRKKAELALKESEEKYRELFNNSTDMVFLVLPGDSDRPSTFIEVNDIVCRTLGYSRDELARLSMFDITAPEYREMLPEIYRELAVKKHTTFQAEYLTKAGQRIPVEVRHHYFELMGRHVSMAVARDISGRKRAETQLQLYRFTLENASDAVCWISADGRFVNVNDAMCRVLGHDRDELLKTDIFRFCPQIEPARWGESMGLMRKIAPLRAEMIWLSRDGLRKPLEAALSFLSFDGHDYLCAFARPITDPGRAGEVLASDAVRLEKYA